ncbi:MAG: cobalamin biosynthesis protein, partial [Planctomycetes bacterium]|nr:cobalamin biosynthesis protein [Planctomycetota bacterium]
IALRLRGLDWRAGWRAARRDHGRTGSPNKGWPMAAVAGGLGIRMEKRDHYSIGEGELPADPAVIIETYRVVRLTALIYFFLFAIPVFMLIGIQVQLMFENMMFGLF